MNILLISNYKYIKYAMVLVQSIFDNCSERPITFYYGYKGERGYYNEEIENFITAKGGILHWIKPELNLNQEIKRANFYSDEVYGTLFPHLWLPNSLERILYLDIDTIVCKDIKELYNLEFDNNYLIAANVKNEDFLDEKRIFSDAEKKRGMCFNSGVILYNLSLLRQKIDISFYTDVINNSEDFFFDQGMLNYLFEGKTKYVSPTKYNYRLYLNRIDFVQDACIIHYVTPKTPYKPWDLLFSDEEVKTIKTPKRSKCMFYINKSDNDLYKIWWGYAHKVPLYGLLLNEMEIKKEYVIRFGLWKRCNYGLGKFFELQKKYAYNEVLEKRYSKGSFFFNIVKDVNENVRVPDIVCKSKDEIYNYSDISNYFSALTNKVIMISVRDTAERYWRDFIVKSGLTALEKINLEHRESFICVMTSDNKLIKYSKSFNEVTLSINIYPNNMDENHDSNSLRLPFKCLIVSLGFQPDSSACISKVIIDNIDFSMNKMGLNIVVIDTDKMVVYDSFNVDTHTDKTLTINR